MALIFAALALFLQAPAGWRQINLRDPISGGVNQSFILKGSWVGFGPEFPYKSAIPGLSVHCNRKGFWFALVDVGALLDTEIHQIAYRLDDRSGLFWIKNPPEPGDKEVRIGKGDFQKILNSKTAIIRVPVFSSGSLTMQFDMPSEVNQVRLSCKLK